MKYCSMVSKPFNFLRMYVCGGWNQMKWVNLKF